jgi:hypothetical protein
VLNWAPLNENILCLSKHHVMHTYVGVEVQLHAFLTSVLDGSECSTSRPGSFTPDLHRIGSCTGLGPGLGAMVNTKIPIPYRISNLGRSDCHLVTIPTDIFQRLIVLVKLSIDYFYSSTDEMSNENNISCEENLLNSQV